jgi:endonuclease/exonuclease/phosphatase (EEP) superfamily protein YafD
VTLIARPRLRLFLTVVLALLSGPPLAIALASLSGIGHRWVDILAQFVGPALVAAVLLTLASLALRLRAAVLLTGIVGVAVVIAGSPQWFPAKGWPTGDEGFTVYFANLYALNTDVEAVDASIRQADPDVVVLIEVSDGVGASLSALLVDYPHRAIGPRSTDGAGPSRSVIASRWPLTKLRTPFAQLYGVAAAAETPIGPVTLAGVHLTRPWPYQYQWGQIIQAQELIDWRRTVSGPLIVAGDFNSVSSARIGRMIRSETRLVAAPGWPGTWHAALPAWAGLTIDQVYRSPDLALVDRRLGRDNGSDHRAVVTRFVRAQAPPTA